MDRDLRVSSFRAEVMDVAARADKRRLRMVKDARCAPRCSGCCSRLVMVSLIEALVLYDELVQTKQWDGVRRRAEEQAPLLRDSGQVSWFKMNQKCPVLDEATDLCRAYQVRPAACSTHFARSDPGLCHPWKAGEGSFAPVDFVDLHGRLLEKLRQAAPDLEYLLTSAPLPLALLMAERLMVKAGGSAGQAISLMRRGG